MNSKNKQYLSRFTDDFDISGTEVYFNSSSVAGDMQCIQFEAVDDDLVEANEVMTFLAAVANSLDAFAEDADRVSLVLYDDDGMYIVMKMVWLIAWLWMTAWL